MEFRLDKFFELIFGGCENFTRSAGVNFECASLSCKK